MDDHPKNDNIEEISRNNRMLVLHRDNNEENVPNLEFGVEISNIIYNFSQEMSLDDEQMNSLLDVLNRIGNYLNNDAIDERHIISELDPNCIDNLMTIFVKLETDEVIEPILQIFKALLDKIEFVVDDNHSIDKIIYLFINRNNSSYNTVMQYLISNWISFDVFHDSIQIVWYDLIPLFSSVLYQSLFIKELTHFKNDIPLDWYERIVTMAGEYLSSCENEEEERNEIIKNTFLFLTHLSQSIVDSESPQYNTYSDCISLLLPQITPYFYENPEILDYLFLFLSSIVDLRISTEYLTSAQMISLLIQRLSEPDEDSQKRGEMILKYFAVLTKIYHFNGNINNIIESCQNMRYDTKCAAMRFVAAYCQESYSFSDFNESLFEILLELISQHSNSIMFDLLSIFDLLLIESTTFKNWLEYNDQLDIEDLENIINEIMEDIEDDDIVCSLAEKILSELSRLFPKYERNNPLS